MGESRLPAALPSHIRSAARRPFFFIAPRHSGLTYKAPCSLPLLHVKPTQARGRQPKLLILSTLTTLSTS